MIKDMAFSKSEAIEKCTSLGTQFIKHFDKIYNNPNSSAVNHWVTEMNNWYNYICKIRLKPDAKPLSLSNKFDWFFTAGAVPSDFLSSSDESEQYYDTFVGYLIGGQTVAEAIQKILIELNNKERK